jgi:hypothetical protein
MLIKSKQWQKVVGAYRMQFTEYGEYTNQPDQGVIVVNSSIVAYGKRIVNSDNNYRLDFELLNTPEDVLEWIYNYKACRTFKEIEMEKTDV